MATIQSANDATNIIAEAIATAFKESKRDLQNRWDNHSIVQPDANAKKRSEYDLENHFFEMVVAYQGLLTDAQYTSLCTKIEILAGERFCYRP